MIDWLSKWLDACKKQTYLNWWEEERLAWFKKNPKTELLPTTTDPNVPTDDGENINGTN